MHFFKADTEIEIGRKSSVESGDTSESGILVLWRDFLLLAVVSVGLKMKRNLSNETQTTIQTALRF